MKVADTIANLSLPSVLAGKEAVNRAFETAWPKAWLSSAVFPLAVCDGRSERRHESLRRKRAPKRGKTNNYLRTQIIRTDRRLGVAAGRDGRHVVAH